MSNIFKLDDIKLPQFHFLLLAFDSVSTAANP